MGRKKASSAYQPMIDEDDDNSLLISDTRPPAAQYPPSSSTIPNYNSPNDSASNNLNTTTPNNNTTFKVMTFEEVVSEIGFGWYQLLLMNVCGAGWLFDGIELTMISFIVPNLTDEWSLSPAQAGSLGSAVFAGMMIGAWCGGLYFCCNDISGSELLTNCDVIIIIINFLFLINYNFTNM